MPRILQQPSYVLHVRAFRETSLLLEMLSRDHGRIALVARGARRPKSRLRGILQPFRPLLSSWTARSELGTLTVAEQVAAPPALAGESLYCGLYLNELLIRLLHRNDPHADVFERYRSTLAELSSGVSPQPVLRLFEKHLLESVGYGLILDHESGTGLAIHPDARYDYRPGEGPVRLASATPVGSNTVSGNALQALDSEQLDEHVLPELRSLMRRIIGYHLGDKPLVSAALFGGPAVKTEQEHEQ
ncbi:MAG: DNA repair protein RecO [Xanthomonadales bacterium]|nr:DNA repair protein RecO [Xanthomonadales bacterium]